MQFSNPRKADVSVSVEIGHRIYRGGNTKSLPYRLSTIPKFTIPFSHVFTV